MQSDSVAICILGMHRSGTSALAGVLNLLGVSMGKELLGPAEDNPKGFYENQKITFLNEYEILPELKTTWDDITPLPLERILQALKNTNLVDNSGQILEEDYSDTSTFGIKDPRMCIIFPFWENILWEKDIEIKVIISYRHSFEVAYSLFHRNGIPLIKGLFLWAKHLLYAEYYSRKYDRIFISYKKLLENPLKVINYIQDSFNLNFSERIDNKIEEIKVFLEKKLSHFNFTSSKMTVNALHFIEELDNLFQLLVSQKIKDTKDIQERFDFLRKEYEKVLNILHLDVIDLKDLKIQLFINKEKGFNEKDSIIKRIEPIKELQEFDFPVNFHIKSLRLDPLNYPCIVSLERIYLISGNNQEKDLMPYTKSNAMDVYENKYLFSTEDPQILFENLEEDCFKDVRELRISLRYDAIGYRSVLEILSKHYSELENEVVSLRQQRTELQDKMSGLESELIAVRQKNDELENEVVSLRQQRTELQDKMSGLESELIAVRQKNDELENEVVSLYLSNSWRITKPLRWIRRKLKI